MKIRNILVRASAVAAALGLSHGGAAAATIGGEHYAPQYDFSEFFAAADGRSFRVVLAGKAFDGVEADRTARELLPLLQAAKPRPALTFTYDTPNEKPRPDYRLVLVFNAANDLGSDAVCKDVTRFKPGTPGAFNVYAVYCRNDQPMSEATARTPAAQPSDPRVATLFRELLPVVFSDSPMLRPQRGGAVRP